jgi:hypothetical protein
MTPKTIILEPFTQGDHFPGIASLTVTVNMNAPASSLSLAVLRFKRVDPIGNIVVLTSTIPGQVTIISEALWTITIPKQAVPGLIEGRWKLQIKLTNALGVIGTFIDGEQVVLPTI